MILKDADGRVNDIAELKRLKEIYPPNYSATIQQQINSIFSGLEGERNAAHFINREFGSSSKLGILHDLRIGHEGDFAQIDHLVIHRIQGTAWLLETKNYSGRLDCDEHGDWTVWNNGKPRPIQSPINQARRQCETLRLWLESNGLKGIHTIQPIVLISPTSSVNRTKIDKRVHVVKSDNFGEWWQKQTDTLGIGTMLNMLGRHIANGMSAEDLSDLGQRLISAHTPITYDWRAMLRLPKEPPAAEASCDAPAENIASSENNQPFKQTVSTPNGLIQISQLADGRYTLRNEKNDLLIEHVKAACKGLGKWNPRYRNWLIDPANLPQVLANIS